MNTPPPHGLVRLPQRQCDDRAVGISDLVCKFAASRIYEFPMKRLLALFLMLVWSISLVGEAVAGDRVFCIGADGHAGFEAAIGVNCAEGSSDQNAIKAPIASPAESSHCGACTDVSVSSGSKTASVFALSVPAPHEKPVPIANLATSVPTLLVSEPAPLFAEPLDRTGPSPRLLEHRSVVLLI